MLTRPDGLKIASAQRVCLRVGSSERDSVSSNSVRTGSLDGNESTWLIDSEVEVVSSGNRDSKSCQSSSFNETHIDDQENVKTLLASKSQ